MNLPYVSPPGTIWRFLVVGNQGLDTATPERIFDSHPELIGAVAIGSKFKKNGFAVSVFDCDLAQIVMGNDLGGFSTPI